MMPSRPQKPTAARETRLIGRLAADPEPADAGMTLRVVVTYGIERHERCVLATGNGGEVARSLHADGLVYVVGHRAEEDDEHEIHTPHVLARGPDREAG